MLPYVPETDLSQVGLNAPKNIQENGFEIRTFMPKWGIINERRGQLHEVIRLSGMNLIIDDTDHPLIIKVASIPQAKVQVYFIDNDDFFMKRQMAIDENGKEYTDNGERAIFFARGVLETVKKLRWTPDVIHCQGWMASIIPLYIKTAYKNDPSFANVKVVTSLFNENLENSLGQNLKHCIEFKTANKKALKEYKDDFDFNELIKLSLDFSDGVIEAVPNKDNTMLNYASEKGLPILNYPGEDFTQAYSDFYNKIAGENK